MRKHNEPSLEAERDALREEVARLNQEIRRRQMELDILKKAEEIIKKDPGISISHLNNREKTKIADALRQTYPLTELLHVLVHVRSEGRIVKQAVYIAIGIDMSGRKDVLGMYVGQNESAEFWLSILNGLKNRGVEDILIACVDGLSGFPQAVEAVYPQTEILIIPGLFGSSAIIRFSIDYLSSSAMIYSE